MARFFGEVTGDKGKQSGSRIGHKGIRAHIRGWESGVEVNGRIQNSVDVFDIYATSGSNGSSSKIFLGTVKLENGTPKFEV